MAGEYEWYVLLIQYLHLNLRTSGLKINDGYAWDIGFVQATSQEEAVKKFKENPQCALRAFELGKKTEVLVHRAEPLDAAMERKDFTPKRVRRKKT